MRADSSTRKMAILKNDSKMILSLVSCYHRTCYRSYTRPDARSNATPEKSCESQQDDEYARLEPDAYQMLFDFIRLDVIENGKVVKLSEISQLLEEFMSLGVKECKPSTKKHIRRKIEAEFGEIAHVCS